MGLELDIILYMYPVYKNLYVKYICLLYLVIHIKIKLIFHVIVKSIHF